MVALKLAPEPPWRPEGFPANTILRVMAGSQLTGTNLEAQSDHDELGVAVETARDVLGLDCFEQKIMRSAGGDNRSGPDDYDITIYALRKFVRLALKGNPTILQLFWADGDAIIEREPLGAELQELAPAFVAKQHGSAFLGYVKSQRERLDGTRGQKNVKRPELEEAHGYDTKYAGHIIRLGLQGIEYLQTGRMSLPLREHDRQMVLAVRRGEVSKREVVMYATELEGELKKWMDRSPLPERPDRDMVIDWLCAVYPQQWWN